jgi:hypothetical protein
VAVIGKAGGYPSLVELHDGRIAMFITPFDGGIQICHSSDRGETWTAAEATGPEPVSGTFGVSRLPDSSDLLLVWNNHPQRTNLTSAISRDGGVTWSNFRLLERQDGWPAQKRWAFPSIAFANGCAHLTYYERSGDLKNQPDASFDLVYRRVDLGWFYRALDYYTGWLL